MIQYQQPSSTDELREELITLVLEKVALEEQAEEDEERSEVVKTTNQGDESESSSYASFQSIR
jgi:hypothetical protein